MFVNGTGSPATFNVIFKDLTIKTTDWCSAVVIDGNEDVTLNATIDGSLSISSHNHAPLKTQDSYTHSLDIHLTRPLCASLSLQTRENNVMIQSNKGSISLTINGESPANKNYSVKAEAHKLTKTDAVAASCEADGNIEYWTCDYCKTLYSDEDGKTVISSEDTVLPKLGHQVAEGLASDANTHWNTCDRCDAKLNEEEHDFSDWATVKAATEEEKGKKERACSVCGYREIEIIPMLEKVTPTSKDTKKTQTQKAQQTKDQKTNVPETGDSSHLLLYVGFLLASLGVSGFLVNRKIKR
jgi:LPXTG-motif cell wall-anchored protein